MELDVLIRADASSVIGSGHVARTSALAERLRAEGIRVGFACRAFRGDRIAAIRTRLFPVYELSPGHTDSQNWLGVSLGDEMKSMCRLLREFDPLPAWVVVDHYCIDARWERCMAAMGTRIFVIDDLADRAHHCEGLLDQNYHHDPEARYMGKVPAHARLFLGPSYALLRSEFLTHRKNRRSRDGTVNRIFVLYGGFDDRGYTRQAVEALVAAQVDAFVDVIAPGNDVLADETTVGTHWNVRLHVNGLTDNVAEMMIEADLAIGGAGVTCWERCFVGLPAIVSAIAPNQQPGLQALEDDNIVLSLGVWSGRERLRIANAVRELVSDPARVCEYGNRSFAICGDADAASAEVLSFIKESIECRN